MCIKAAKLKEVLPSVCWILLMGRQLTKDGKVYFLDKYVTLQFNALII